jgi:hypothetical protein
VLERNVIEIRALSNCVKQEVKNVKMPTLVAASYVYRAANHIKYKVVEEISVNSIM